MSEDVSSNNSSPFHATQHTLNPPNTSPNDTDYEIAPSEAVPWICKTEAVGSNSDPLANNSNSPPLQLTTCGLSLHNDTTHSSHTLPPIPDSTDDTSTSESEGDSGDGDGCKRILKDHCYSPSTPSPLPKKTRPYRQDNTSLSAAIPAFRLAYAPAVPTTSVLLQRLLQLNPNRPGPHSSPARAMFTAARGQTPPRVLTHPNRADIKRPNFYSQFQHRPTLSGGNRLFHRGGSRGRGRGQPVPLSPLPQKKKLLKRKHSESPGGSTDTDDDTSQLLCRRSDRNIGKKQKYRYEVDLNLSDDGSEEESRRAKKTQGPILPRPSEIYKHRPSLMSTSEDTFLQWSSEEEYTIDKVLATRNMDNEDQEQFYIKFKGFSYLHAKWSTLPLLNQMDKRAAQKINRYRQKQQAGLSLLEEEGPFNPDYLQVDRILDTERVRGGEGEVHAYCLVKWCSLPYEDITWELKENIPDADKFREFEQINRPPPPSSLSHRPRPSAELPVSTASREYRNHNFLRPYQQVGLNWLVMKWFSRKNCILADEMGLGKTIQTISFLNAVVEYGIRGPFLIIAPLSTIQNWYREFQNWTSLNAIVYHGTAHSRRLIEEHEFYFKGRRQCYKFTAVITTYEAAMIETSELTNVPWRVTVIDEAHRLKNTRAKLTSHLKAFDMEHKILLTGTPLQNSVEELWSLLNFLDPVRFDSDQEFLAKFGQLQSEEQVIDLQKVLKPMVLRRLKEDVEKNLAPKEETIIEVELTSIQKKYYRAIMERNFSFLMAKTTSRSLPSVMNLFMELRKCCNHPFLIKGAESHITEEWLRFHPKEESWRALLQASGKLVLVDKLLTKLREEHKVLIFSQMVKCLDILEDYLIWKRYPYERIDGQVRGNLRQAAIDRFSKPGSDRFVFLLCTRAGGLGINLTAADTVIIYDSDWNPQNDLQAQARCHRIGQDKAVKVYRLITRNSYERQMFDKASMKLGLDKAVLQSVNNGQREQSGQLSKLQVEDLLKRGAYGALLDEDDSACFCNEDIEVILARRTQVVTIDTLGHKNSTFAKASFASSEGDSEISMDDPDFWQKWALRAEIDLAKLEDKTDGLILHEPRERKQTKRFEIQDPSFDAAAVGPCSNSSSGGEEEEVQGVDTDPQCPLFRGVCMKIESALMTYGWGRWHMMLRNADLKLSFKPRDLELICRQILVFSLHHFRGDEKVKSTIHSLLSQDTPTECTREEHEHMLSQSPDSLFSDSAYKRHLQRVSGRVLQRVRVLHHIRSYIIAESYDRLMSGELSIDQFDAHLPEIENPPAPWWDRSADKSLILGTIKHGYENYSLMAEDQCLQFCPPSLPSEGEGNGTDVPMSEGSEGVKELDENSMDTCEVEENHSHPVRDWPSVAELNNRLKKMVTESDRNLKKIVLRSERQALRDKKKEGRQGSRRSARSVPSGWTGREEQGFYRAVYSHGVTFNAARNSHDWSRVRETARLKKSNEQIEAFYTDFVAMCYTVYTKGFPPSNGGGVTPVREGRAHKFLKRLHLLSLVREVLADEKLEEILQVSGNTEVPQWWCVPTHDLDLLKGVAKHGLTRSDLKIYSDTELSFSQTVPATQQEAPPGKKLAQRLPPSWPSRQFILSRLTSLVFLVKNHSWPEHLPPLPPVQLDTSVYGPYGIESALQGDSMDPPTEQLELIVSIPFPEGVGGVSSDAENSSSGSSGLSATELSDNSDSSESEEVSRSSQIDPPPPPPPEQEALLISIPLDKVEERL